MVLQGLKIKQSSSVRLLLKSSMLLRLLPMLLFMSMRTVRPTRLRPHRQLLASKCLSLLHHSKLPSQLLSRLWRLLLCCLPQLHCCPLRRLCRQRRRCRHRQSYIQACHFICYDRFVHCAVFLYARVRIPPICTCSVFLKCCPSKVICSACP